VVLYNIYSEHFLEQTEHNNMVPPRNIVMTPYGYDRQHNSKAEYLRVKTRTDVDMYITYLI
jgi:hypothetical protein